MEVLRYLQESLLHGRPLHVVDDTCTIEILTNCIIVDRDNILDTTYQELPYIEDYCITFEIDFMGEKAKDLGGLRLEWIEVCNREQYIKYFSNGLREHLAKDYFYVGIMVGVAMLQNGQMPRLFSSEILDVLFTIPKSKLHVYIQNLQKGLKVFGLQNIFHEFPTMRDLLQPTAKKLNVKDLTRLLTPQFSDEGTAMLIREKNIYQQFLKYVREVASGRRNGMDLTKILQFTTSCTEEPVLGFSLNSCITFYQQVFEVRVIFCIYSANGRRRRGSTIISFKLLQN